jgi:hypothetical protein
MYGTTREKGTRVEGQPEEAEEQRKKKRAHECAGGIKKLPAAKGEAPTGRVAHRAMRIDRFNLFSLSWMAWEAAERCAFNI